MKKIFSLMVAAILALAATSCQEDPVYYNLEYEAISTPSMNMSIYLAKPNQDILHHTGGSHLLQDCGPVKPGYLATINAEVLNPLPGLMEDAEITLRIIIDDKIVKETTAKSTASLTYTVGE